MSAQNGASRPKKKSKKRVVESPTLYVHGKTTINESFRTDSDYRYLKRSRLREAAIPDINLSDAETERDNDVSQYDSLSLDFDPSEQATVEIDVQGVTVVAKPPAKRYDSSDAPLKIFLAFRDQYLDEILATDGRGLYAEVAVCPTCKDGQALIRCLDCFGGELVCEKCAVRLHRAAPLHRVQKWDTTSFTRTTLKDLGLVVQLGHRLGTCCSNASKARPITVMDTNAFHIVAVQFCGCQFGFSPFQQFLAVRWFPATPLQPKTAFTFNLMRQFQYQNLQGALTAYDFYRSLELLTDGRLSVDIPDREHAFNIAIREWRHLKSLKRAGRGHDTSGVRGTRQGELALRCRACPHPGVNLFNGWETVPRVLAFLYYAFQAEDGNFRLKGRLRETKMEDITLSPGLAYFVEETAYQAYVSRYRTQEEISTCSGFAAIHLANLKKMRGLRATGVVGTACSRHELWKPNGMGDLQKGERYCNMDYVFMSSLQYLGACVLVLVITYDIACQYFKNFFARAESLPVNLQPSFSASNIIAKVPKCYLVGHGPKCHGPYSLNYTTGAGRTDGEGIERRWPLLNKAAPSVREMTPAGRRETVDDFCGFANWMKTLTIGDLLIRRMLEALDEAKDNMEDFNRWDGALRLMNPQDVLKWEQEVEAYRVNKSKPCPYMVSSETVTVDRTRATLVVKEQKALQDGLIKMAGTDGPSAFITAGFDIESRQRLLRYDVKHLPDARLNALDAASRAERRIAVRKQLDAFRQQQELHMPGVVGILEAFEDAQDADAWLVENAPLYLPSALDAKTRSLICDARLIETETTLREAQAKEALDNLRQELRVRSVANQFKIDNITGQVNNTRARTHQKTIDDKILSYKHTYRAARAALLALSGPGDWEQTLRPLLDADVRSYNERAMTEQESREREEAKRKAGLIREEITAVPLESGGVSLGDGRQRISWIWISADALASDKSDSPGNEKAMHEALKVQWARAKARQERWIEEVALLWEEMRRTVVSTLYLEAQWRRRTSQKESLSLRVREGSQAYAIRQAEGELALARQWRTRFAPLCEKALCFLRTTYLHDIVSIAAMQDVWADARLDTDETFAYQQSLTQPRVELDLRRSGPAEDEWN